MATAAVALVLVSHSAQVAAGLAEVAGQMAPDVLLVPAGGTDDGRIGTGFDLVTRALETAVSDGRSAVVLTDLGSATLTAESVLELASDDVAARVRIADAPFVEGAVEAAVAAQGGGDLTDVVDAAERAAGSFARSRSTEAETRAGDAAGAVDDSAAGTDAEGRSASGPPGQASDSAPTGRPVPPDGAARSGLPSSAEPAAATSSPATPAAPGGVPTARGTAVLRNRLGLHARPAAQVARTAGAFDAVITVNGADARSVLALVGLGAVGGTEVVVAASGPQARTAVNAVIDELENGFGEA